MIRIGLAPVRLRYLFQSFRNCDMMSVFELNIHGQPSHMLVNILKGSTVHDLSSTLFHLFDEQRRSALVYVSKTNNVPVTIVSQCQQPQSTFIMKNATNKASIIVNVSRTFRFQLFCRMSVRPYI